MRRGSCTCFPLGPTTIILNRHTFAGQILFAITEDIVRLLLRHLHFVFIVSSLMQGSITRARCRFSLRH